MSWLKRNAGSVEAIAASVTVMVAVAALVGIKWQLDGAEQLQAAQSARDAYRAHLALAATIPDFAAPQDGCILLASDQGGSYRAFVDHLLYSAEQMLEVEDGWDITFLQQLDPHSDFLCSADAPDVATPALAALITRFQTAGCPAKLTCQQHNPL